MDIKSDKNAEYYNRDEKLYDQLTQTSEGNSSTNSILDNQLTQTSEGNVLTNSSKNTKKLLPLWLYFSFKPSHSDIPICDKYDQKFSSKSGNLSLERHLNSQYNIIIPKIKCYQSKLPFVHNNPWPEAQKKESHEKEFPVLARMSSDYLSIQATSVACEQAFLVATNTISHTQSYLDPETSKASLYAKSWIENEIVKI
ncbi:1371_t:CDS:2, partial [Gigaspora margarita]